MYYTLPHPEYVAALPVEYSCAPCMSLLTSCTLLVTNKSGTRVSRKYTNSFLTKLMKKLDTLQHLLRTTAANSQNWNSKYHKIWY